MNALRLAIVASHPIQYYAPIFQALSQSAQLAPKVFYTWSQSADNALLDPGFGHRVSWDIPLLEGYEHEFVTNLAKQPGTHHFNGLHNPGLVPTVERWRPDAILVFGWNLRSHLRVLRHFKGRIPVFFRGDSTLLDRRSGWRTQARRTVLRWIYRRIDVALAVGSNNTDYFRWCGVSDSQITCVPHAIDTQRFADPDGLHRRRAAQWRAELAIPTEARVLLFAAKFLPKKDPLLLLEAFRQAGAPAHLVFAGSGALEGELRARAADLRNVHFLPFQNQRAMPSLYRLADVFILPSRGPGETWGLALNEAMTCGCAVIASDRVGGTRDLIIDAVTGWRFPAGDLNALAAVLRDALTCEPLLLEQMRQAAHLRSAYWSIEATAGQIERAVLDFAAGGSLKKRHTATS